MRAILTMLLAMAGFALGDAFIKLASNDLAIGQILIGISLPGAIVFAIMAQRAGQPVLSSGFLHPRVVLRNLVEGMCAFCMISALSSAPLALVVSINQAVPLLVTLAAVVLLRETVGVRRWSAIVIGLIGVLIMLRPGTDELPVGALYALIATIGLAVRDVITRTVPDHIGNLQMATWGMAALLPVGAALYMLATPEPAPTITAVSAGAVAIAALATAVGYYAITAAMRMGDVSVVSPFRYSRLLFSLILTVVMFGERPDALTLLGATIVIGSGLFVMWRERTARR